MFPGVLLSVRDQLSQNRLDVWLLRDRTDHFGTKYQNLVLSTARVKFFSFPAIMIVFRASIFSFLQFFSNVNSFCDVSRNIGFL